MFKKSKKRKIVYIKQTKRTILHNVQECLDRKNVDKVTIWHRNFKAHLEDLMLSKVERWGIKG